MKIDITKLLYNNEEIIEFEKDIDIPKKNFINTLIDDLKNIKLEGNVVLNEEEDIILSGTLNGIMILKDDITLEPVEYAFKTEIEEILEKNKNILDITDILWQNILVEIPSKVRSTDEDIDLRGNGWRVISEEKFLEERNSTNNQLSNLGELLKIKEEK